MKGLLYFLAESNAEAVPAVFSFHNQGFMMGWCSR